MDKKHYILVLIAVLLTSIVTITIIGNDNSNLTKENKELKERIAELEIENQNQHDAIIQKNGDIYTLEEILRELKQLYFDAIGFIPDHSYPYK